MTGSEIRPTEPRADATVMEVARRLKREIALGHNARAIRAALWSPSCVLIDHDGRVCRGLHEIEAWASAWEEHYQMESVTYSDPFIGASSLAMHMAMRARRLADGSIDEFAQISVYTVTDGLVTREEFLRGGLL